MRLVLKPGTFLCIDESMCAWQGMESKIAGKFGMPHVTKIARKPEGIGAEFKTLADVDTGTIINMDIMEGSDRNRRKVFADIGSGVGQCLRLTLAYHGTGRVLIGDSAFASFKTVVELKKVGLYFQGCVKTAHREYPKAFLDRWLQGNSNRAQRGQFKLCRTALPQGIGEHVYAIAWADKKGKQFVFNTGNTLPGSDSVRRRHKRVREGDTWGMESYEKRVKRPSVVEELFEGFSTIDIQNHIRQGILEIEREWATHRWWIRTFGTLWGIAITNAYLLYRYEYKLKHFGEYEGSLNLYEFAGQLSKQLISNVFLDNTRKRRHDENSNNGDLSNMVPFLHGLAPLIDLPYYTSYRGTQKRAKRICKVCQSRTAYYCVQCSDVAQMNLLCFCKVGGCFARHIGQIVEKSDI
jgi:hypothetical protein